MMCFGSLREELSDAYHHGEPCDCECRQHCGRSCMCPLPGDPPFVYKPHTPGNNRLLPIEVWNDFLHRAYNKDDTP